MNSLNSHPKLFKIRIHICSQNRYKVRKRVNTIYGFDRLNYSDCVRNVYNSMLVTLLIIPLWAISPNFHEHFTLIPTVLDIVILNK